MECIVMNTFDIILDSTFLVLTLLFFIWKAFKYILNIFYNVSRILKYCFCASKLLMKCMKKIETWWNTI